MRLMIRFAKYFDLAQELRAGTLQSSGQSKTRKKYTIHWVPQYIALFLGILAEQFIVPMIKNPKLPTDFEWRWLLISSFAAVVAFPGTYRASFDARKPWFVHCCVIFITGLGWRSLFP